MTTNDLINEIEEAVRREKLEKAAKEYGPYVIAGCVIAILITALTAGWSSWQLRSNAAHTAALLAAAESANPARTLGEAAERLGADQAVVARLAAAGMHMENNQTGEALAEFRLAAGMNKAPALLRDLALLQTVRMEWDAGSAEAPALLARLAPLANDNKNAWQAHAQVLSAVITAHGLNDYAAARKWLAPVIARKDALPPSLLQRARALDHLYSLKSAQKTTDEATQG